MRARLGEYPLQRAVPSQAGRGRFQASWRVVVAGLAMAGGQPCGAVAGAFPSELPGESTVRSWPRPLWIFAMLIRASRANSAMSAGLTRGRAGTGASGIGKRCFGIRRASGRRRAGAPFYHQAATERREDLRAVRRPRLRLAQSCNMASRRQSGRADTGRPSCWRIARA
jgi:hypothetical protein